MLSLELECRLATQRMEHLRRRADRRRLLLLARTTPGAERRDAGSVRIRRAPSTAPSPSERDGEGVANAP